MEMGSLNSLFGYFYLIPHPFLPSQYVTVGDMIWWSTTIVCSDVEYKEGRTAAELLVPIPGIVSQDK